jgi:hypothetical protein
LTVATDSVAKIVLGTSKKARWRVASNTDLLYVNDRFLVRYVVDDSISDVQICDLWSSGKGLVIYTQKDRVALNIQSNHTGSGSLFRMTSVNQRKNDLSYVCEAIDFPRHTTCLFGV